MVFIRRRPHQLRASALSGHEFIMLDPTCGSGSAVRAAEITRGEVAFPRMAVPKMGSTDRVEDTDVKL